MAQDSSHGRVTYIGDSAEVSVSIEKDSGRREHRIKYEWMPNPGLHHVGIEYTGEGKRGKLDYRCPSGSGEGMSVSMEEDPGKEVWKELLDTLRANQIEFNDTELHTDMYNHAVLALAEAVRERPTGALTRQAAGILGRMFGSGQHT